MKHSTHLAPYIEEAMGCANEKGLTLDAVAVSCGPGSYTGLRIGVSTAKGLCYGGNIPLIAVNTLDVMVAALIARHQVPSETLLCPMLDARRMEVYTAQYGADGVRKTAVTAEIIDETSYAAELAAGSVLFFGNGAEKCQAVLTHPSASFDGSIDPLAVNMVQLAEDAFSKSEFADVAYFEPFYLKEFVATTPKNKVLGQ